MCFKSKEKERPRSAHATVVEVGRQVHRICHFVVVFADKEGLLAMGTGHKGEVNVQRGDEIEHSDECPDVALSYVPCIVGDRK